MTKSEWLEQSIQNHMLDNFIIEFCSVEDKELFCNILDLKSIPYIIKKDLRCNVGIRVIFSKSDIIDNIYIDYIEADLSNVI
jgi:hypothetical protein